MPLFIDSLVNNLREALTFPDRINLANVFEIEFAVCLFEVTRRRWKSLQFLITFSRMRRPCNNFIRSSTFTQWLLALLLLNGFCSIRVGRTMNIFRAMPWKPLLLLQRSDHVVNSLINNLGAFLESNLN